MNLDREYGEEERDHWQEYKDDLAMGCIYEDGSPRDPEPPDDAYEGDADLDDVARKSRRLRVRRPRLAHSYALRLGPVEIVIRRRHGSPPCGACQGRGLFHTKSGLDPYPAPDGYDGVALCGCGTAIDRLADIWRTRDWKTAHPEVFPV